MTEAFHQNNYETFEFAWAGIDPEYQWVAIDRDKTVAVFNNRPVWHQGEWVYPESGDCKHLLLPSLGIQGSSLHLMKRPTEAPTKAATPACKHAELMLQYAQDAMKYEKPWEWWEASCDPTVWSALYTHPAWNPDKYYRRKPITLEVPIRHKEAVEAFIKSLEQ